MSDFDIDALEQALSSKGRSVTPKLKLKQPLPKTRQGLLNEVYRLAKELASTKQREALTRFEGYFYKATEYASIKMNNRTIDDRKVPTEVLERLIANSRSKLADYHKEINKLAIGNPELVLEGNLEGKSGHEILNYVYNAKYKRLVAVFDRAIYTPDGIRVFTEVNVYVESDDMPQYIVNTGCWSNRSYPSISGVDISPSALTEVAKFVHFLNHFDQFLEKVKQSLSKIQIRR